MEFQGMVKQIVEKAKLDKKKIVLPESNDLRVLKAANILVKEGIADVILIGSLEEIEFLCKANELELDLEHITIENPLISEKREFYINALYELRKNKGLSMVEAIELVNDNIYFATMMVKLKDADGMVCGATHSTAETLRPALQIIKTAEGVDQVSSFFIMEIPNCEYEQDGVYVFSDCGIVVDPTPNELANIAINSANSCRKLLGKQPKVALLSYSSLGSAKSEKIDKVKEALDIVREKDEKLEIDGELQLDAAIVKEVANLKAPHSKVAGNANVLIFPNIEAGNIGYKLVQRFAKAVAIGPLTQGFAKPVNDLSRGCSVQEIIGAVAVTCLQAKEEE